MLKLVTFRKDEGKDFFFKMLNMQSSNRDENSSDVMSYLK